MYVLEQEKKNLLSPPPPRPTYRTQPPPNKFTQLLKAPLWPGISNCYRYQCTKQVSLHQKSDQLDHSHQARLAQSVERETLITHVLTDTII